MGGSKICLAVMMAVLAVSLMSSAEAQNPPSCASKLVSCAGDLNSTKPSNSCCSAIKEAVNNEFTCLCTLYNTPGVLQSFGVTVDQAIRLTQACGVPVELNKCPNSTSAVPPSSQTPPAGVPGADSGVERMAWTGISTFFLFFVSAMFC
ncbi:hypothetical protein UlMin_001268 [Ulmus minor]